MKLKSVVELASIFLGLDELVGLGIFLHDEMTPEAASIQSSSADLRRLITCANNIIKEVASDYARLLTTECVTVSNGRVLYNSLSRPLFQPVALYGKDGNLIRFKAANDGIIPEGVGASKLEYAYIPESAGLFGEVICDPRITDRILAYGTVSEYALIGGLHDIVYLWDRRFHDGLQAALSNGGRTRVLPAPKWK